MNLCLFLPLYTSDHYAVVRKDHIQLRLPRKITTFCGFWQGGIQMMTMIFDLESFIPIGGAPVNFQKLGR